MQKKNDISLESHEQIYSLLSQLFIHSLPSGYFILFPMIQIISTQPVIRCELLTRRWESLGELFVAFRDVCQQAVNRKEDFGLDVAELSEYLDALDKVAPLFSFQKNSAGLIKKAAQKLSKFPLMHDKNSSIKCFYVSQTLNKYQYELFSIIRQGLLFCDRYGVDGIQTERYVQQASTALLWYYLLKNRRHHVSSLEVFDRFRLLVSQDLKQKIHTIYSRYEQQQLGTAWKIALQFFQDYLKGALVIGDYSPVGSSCVEKEIGLPPLMSIVLISESLKTLSKSRHFLRAYIAFLGNPSVAKKLDSRDELISKALYQSLYAFAAFVQDVLFTLSMHSGDGLSTFSRMHEDYSNPSVSGEASSIFLASFQLLKTKMPHTNMLYCKENQLAQRQSVLLIFSISLSVFFTIIGFVAQMSVSIPAIALASLVLAFFAVFVFLKKHGDSICRLVDIFAHDLAQPGFFDVLKKGIDECANDPSTLFALAFHLSPKQAQQRRVPQVPTQQKPNAFTPPMAAAQVERVSKSDDSRPVALTPYTRLALAANSLFTPPKKTASTFLDSELFWEIEGETYATRPEEGSNNRQVYPLYLQGRLVYYVALAPKLGEQEIFLKTIKSYGVIEFIGPKSETNGLKLIANERRAIDGLSITFPFVEYKNFSMGDSRLVNNGIPYFAENSPDAKPLLLLTREVNHRKVKALAEDFVQGAVEGYQRYSAGKPPRLCMK